MEEEANALLFSHPLPVFGVECFGSALSDDGRFARMTGLAPAPPLLRYHDGSWFTNADWVALARHDLNVQPGAWVSSLVDASERHAERAIASFDTDGSPEHVANGLCELYGVLAPAMTALSLLDGLLERRVRLLLEHTHVPADQHASWLNVFRYPEKKTAAMKEREMFFPFAEFVRRHAMNQSTRRQMGAYARRYGYLGLVTPMARPLALADMLHRVSQMEGDPEELRKREVAARTQVLFRADEFMNRTGLSAADRDALRAYRDVSYWKSRERELLALAEVGMKPAVKRLAEYVKLSPEQLLALRVEELSHAILHKGSVPAAFELDERMKKKCSALFVEDLVEMHWE